MLDMRIKAEDLPDDDDESESSESLGPPPLMPVQHSAEQAIPARVFSDPGPVSLTAWFKEVDDAAQRSKMIRWCFYRIT